MNDKQAKRLRRYILATEGAHPKTLRSVYQKTKLDMKRSHLMFAWNRRTKEITVVPR